VIKHEISLYIKKDLKNRLSTLNRDLELHREDGLPAVRWWYEGVVWKIDYYLNGKYHREGVDLPAHLEWGEEGFICSESYYRRGQLHREGDLPAKTIWGHVSYWKDGKKYDPTYCCNYSELLTKTATTNKKSILMQKVLKLLKCFGIKIL
jgi:hypothetical protein